MVAETSPLLPRTASGSRQLTYKDGLKFFLFGGYLNWLLVFIPLTFLSGPLGLSQSITFIFSLLAILPLAAILGDATEQCAILLGPGLGGLLNATFGNAEELIVGILAVNKGKLALAQTSLVGSVLSNAGLVLGCAFVAAGLKYDECAFSDTMAQASSSVLVLACAAFIMPATYQVLQSEATEESLLEVSRYSSVLLVVVYALFLYFQLSSHSYLILGQPGSEDETDEELSSPLWTSVGVLVGVTVITSFVADYLVDSLDEFAADFNISQPFLGLVVIPIAGNAAEHVTSIWMARKGKMELAIGVAIGSSNQIALGVLPALVLFAWIVGQPFSLYLGSLNTVALTITALLAHLVLLDGKSNYLEGSLLVVLYLIFASIFWVSE